VNSPNIVKINQDNNFTFRYRFYNDNSESVDISSINTITYENITSDLQELSDGTWGNTYIFIFPSGEIRLQYGQSEYTDKESALKGLNDLKQETAIKENSVLLGIITYEKGITNYSNAIFTISDHFGNVGRGASSGGGANTTTLQEAFNNENDGTIQITNSKSFGVNNSGGEQILTVSNERIVIIPEDASFSLGSYTDVERTLNTLDTSMATVETRLDTLDTSLNLTSINETNIIYKGELNDLSSSDNFVYETATSMVKLGGGTSYTSNDINKDTYLTTKLYITGNNDGPTITLYDSNSLGNPSIQFIRGNKEYGKDVFTDYRIKSDNGRLNIEYDVSGVNPLYTKPIQINANDIGINIEPDATLDIQNNFMLNFVSELSDLSNQTNVVFRARPDSINASNLALQMSAYDDNTFIIQTNDPQATMTKKLVINPFGGNTGFGLSQPLYTVHISGDLVVNERNITDDLDTLDTSMGISENRLDTLDISMSDVIENAYNNSSTGLVNGGTLSINTDNTKFDLSSGFGQIVNTITNLVNWNDFIAVDISSLGNGTPLEDRPFTHIYINEDGNIHQEKVEVTPDLRRDYIYIGKIVHNQTNGTIQVAFSQPEISYRPSNNFHDFVNGIANVIILNGCLITAGTGVGLNISEGSLYGTGIYYNTNVKSPNIKPINGSNDFTFRYRYYRDNTESEDVNAIDTTHYEDKTSGLQTLNNNRWTNSYVFIFPSGIIRLQYGQSQYFSKRLALNDLNNLEKETNIKDNAVLLAIITYEKGVSDFSNAVITSADHFGDVGRGTSTGGSANTTTLQQAFDNEDDGGFNIEPTKQFTVNDNNGDEILTVSNERLVIIPQDASFSLGSYIDVERTLDILDTSIGIAFNDISDLDISINYIKSNYLPLSGGDMTGRINSYGAGSSKLRFYSDSSTTDNWIESFDENNNRIWILNMLDRSIRESLAFYSQNTGTYMFLLDISGNVGINNTNPNEKLHISGSNDERHELMITGTYLNTNIKHAMVMGYSPSLIEGGIYSNPGSSFMYYGTTSRKTRGIAFVTNISTTAHEGETDANMQSATKMVINNSGVVGIGTTNPSSSLSKFQIYDTTLKFEVRNNGDVYSATGNYLTISDKKRKCNISNVMSTIETARAPLDVIEKIRAVTYQFRPNLNNSDSNKTIGIIADELSNELPILVSNTTTDTLLSKYDSTTYKNSESINQDFTSCVNYNGIISTLLESVKQLTNEITELREIIDYNSGKAPSETSYSSQPKLETPSLINPFEKKDTNVPYYQKKDEIYSIPYYSVLQGASGNTNLIDNIENAFSLSFEDLDNLTRKPSDNLYITISDMICIPIEDTVKIFISGYVRFIETGTYFISFIVKKNIDGSTDTAFGYNGVQVLSRGSKDTPEPTQQMFVKSIKYNETNGYLYASGHWFNSNIRQGYISKVDVSSGDYNTASDNFGNNESIFDINSYYTKIYGVIGLSDGSEITRLDTSSNTFDLTSTVITYTSNIESYNVLGINNRIVVPIYRAEDIDGKVFVILDSRSRGDLTNLYSDGGIDHVEIQGSEGINLEYISSVYSQTHSCILIYLLEKDTTGDSTITNYKLIKLNVIFSDDTASNIISDISNEGFGTDSESGFNDIIIDQTGLSDEYITSNYQKIDKIELDASFGDLGFYTIDISNITGDSEFKARRKGFVYHQLTLINNTVIIPLNLSKIKDEDYQLKQEEFITAIIRFDLNTNEVDTTFSQRSPTELFETSQSYEKMSDKLQRTKKGILKFNLLNQSSITHMPSYQSINSITNDTENIYITNEIKPYVAKIQYFSLDVSSSSSITHNTQFSSYYNQPFNYGIDIRRDSYPDLSTNITRVEDYAEFMSKGDMTNKIYICGEVVKQSDNILNEQKTCWITRFEDPVNGIIDTSFGYVDKTEDNSDEYYRENIVKLTSENGFIHFNIYNNNEQFVFAVRELDLSHVYVAGFVGGNESDGYTSLYLAKINHTTLELDTTFGELGKGITITSIGNASSDFVWNMRIVEDGNIILAGYTSLNSKATDDSETNYGKMYILKYTSEGILDNMFGSNGLWIPYLKNGNNYDLEHDEYGYNILYREDTKQYILTGDTYIYDEDSYDFISKLYVIDNSYDNVITQDFTFDSSSDGDSTQTQNYTATTSYNEFTISYETIDCSNINKPCSIDVQNTGNEFTLTYTKCQFHDGDTFIVDLQITSHDVSYTEISYNHGQTANQSIDNGYDSLYTSIVDSSNGIVMGGQFNMFIPTFIRYDENYNFKNELKLDDDVQDAGINQLIIFAMTQTSNGRIIFGGYTPSNIENDDGNEYSIVQNKVVFGALKINSNGELERDTSFYNDNGTNKHYRILDANPDIFQTQQIYFAESIGNNVFMTGLNQQLGPEIAMVTRFTPPS
jgi:hypothetical protein